MKRAAAMVCLVERLREKLDLPHFKRPITSRPGYIAATAFT